MVAIPFPAAAVVTSMSLQQVHLGDVVHRSIYTGAQQTLARAPGRWTGFIELAETDQRLEADRREIEAWLIALRGTVNTTEIPLSGRDGPASAASLVWAAGAGTSVDKRDARGVNADGSAWLLVQPAAEYPGRGDYIRVGARLYSVQEAVTTVPWVLDAHGLDQSGIRVVPGVYPTTEVDPQPVLRTGLSIRAQVVDEAPTLPMDGEYAGPWRFRWIEVP